MLSLDQISSCVRQHGLPPVSSWDPAHCGAIDIVIRKDGSWWHEGSLIRRQELVVLFAGLLRREDQRYFLVTPVEKMEIQVEDRPFVVTLMEYDGADLQVMTSVGESAVVGPDHSLVFSELDGVWLPEVEIRSGLWARFSRAAWYDLINQIGFEEDGDMAIISGQCRFPIPVE